MDLKEIYRIAKEKFKGACRVCPVCNERACAGEMRGIGGIGTGSSFIASYESLARVKLNLRTLHEVREPDIGFDFFGRPLKMPILVAPVAGMGINMGNAMEERPYLSAMVAGAKEAGSMACTCDGLVPLFFDLGVEILKEHGGWGMPTLKPRPEETFLPLARRAEECGVNAIATDIDAAGIIHLKKAGQPAGPWPVKAWEKTIAQVKVPVILKAVMTGEIERDLEQPAGIAVDQFEFDLRQALRAAIGIDAAGIVRQLDVGVVETQRPDRAAEIRLEHRRERGRIEIRTELASKNLELRLVERRYGPAYIALEFLVHVRAGNAGRQLDGLHPAPRDPAHAKRDAGACQQPLRGVEVNRAQTLNARRSACQRGQETVFAECCRSPHRQEQFQFEFTDIDQHEPLVSLRGTLSTDSSMLTAGANDIGYDNVFARAVEGLGNTGDVLIAISTTSGKSESVNRAVRMAKEKGMTTIGLLGKDGGTTRELVDIPIIVPSGDTQRIQEGHITIGHILSLVERELYA